MVDNQLVTMEITPEDYRRKKIAIVGSASEERASDLGLVNVELAKHIGQELGKQLANAEFDIVVYSTVEGMFEVAVAQGYSTVSTTEDSIHVSYSSHPDLQEFKPNFDGIVENKDLLQERTVFDSNWETAFYTSIAEDDGIILLGGGSSTLIAGLVAMGHKKPILALSICGGAAEKVLKVLVNHPDYRDVGQNLWNEMSTSVSWSSSSAEKLIRVLIQQFSVRKKQQDDENTKQDQLFHERLKDELDKQERVVDLKKSKRTYEILVGVMLIPFITLLILSQSTAISERSWMYAIVLILPIFGGAIGAYIRILRRLNQIFNELTDANGVVKEKEIFMNVGLGVAGGFLAALIFIIGQITSVSVVDLEASEILKQLRPLTWFVAGISVSGGLASETVFARLDNLRNKEDFSGS